MTYSPETVYGLDIETLNDEDRGFHGLDPARSMITDVAVATDESINGGGEVFSGQETKILRDLDLFIRSLRPGLITTWNGSFFDLPFIWDRLPGVGLRPDQYGLLLQFAPSLRPKYDALPGHATDDNPGGGYSATWRAAHYGPGAIATHAHLDVSQAYRRFADLRGVKWSLKPVCEAAEIQMFEIDRTRVHIYSEAERRRYVLSDARGTRELALRTLGLDYLPYRKV